MLLLEESKTQSARHAEATVVGCAAAKTDDDFSRTAPGRIQNHFANTKCVRANRISFVFGEPSHPGGFAHFHSGYFFIADPGVTRVDLTAERVMYFALYPGTAARIANNFRGSLAAIRHRRNFDFRIRQDIAQSCRDVFRNLPRTKRAFEFVRGD